MIRRLSRTPGVSGSAPASRAAAGSFRRSRLAPPLLLLAVTLSLGCTTQRPRPAAAADGPITELNLLAMSTAVNLDARPGADGVLVKIFAVRRGAAKASAIRTGVLEIQAFDGTLDADRLVEPFHVWRFTPDQLKPFQFTATLGTGYNLLLDWTPLILTGSRVTLIARYLPPAGSPVTSEPGYVAAVTL